MATTLNFTSGSEQVLRNEKQDALDDQHHLIDLGLCSLANEMEDDESGQAESEVASEVNLSGGKP